LHHKLKPAVPGLMLGQGRLEHATLTWKWVALKASVCCTEFCGCT